MSHSRGPKILTRYHGEAPRLNVRVSEEMHRKIASLAEANRWSYSRAARYVLASGLIATRDACAS